MEIESENAALRAVALKPGEVRAKWDEGDAATDRHLVEVNP